MTRLVGVFRRGRRHVDPTRRLRRHPPLKGRDRRVAADLMTRDKKGVWNFYLSQGQPFCRGFARCKNRRANLSTWIVASDVVQVGFALAGGLDPRPHVSPYPGMTGGGCHSLLPTMSARCR
ncbi:hypothetical protein CHELA1G11_11019 [Hyphomicrobiales bacterium]|nr:hypothetical protein CHELA1G11_11019 [Hyphomicrobiales bacterium]CAH1670697.1 hypothetical protein CHELA1G2_13290 [Hyphomicrobiales bacterium]